MSKYMPKQKVAFKGYDESVEQKDRLFAKGEVLLLVENDDSGTAENPSFLAHAVANPEKQAYVFSTELGEVQTDEPVAAAKAGKLKVRKTAPVAPAATAAKPAAKAEAKAPAKAPVKAAVKPAAAPAVKTPVAAKAAKKPLAPAAPVEVKALTHSSSVKKLVMGGGKATLEAASKIAERIGSDFYLLGGLLYQIKEMAYFETLKGEDGKCLLGQPGFESYIQSELGIEYRMAQHYINVYVVTRQAGIPETKVKGLKCSKIVALLGLIKQGAINSENWDEWADKAVTLKGDAYKDAVEKAHVAAGITKLKSRGVTANQVRFNFVLFDDRAKVVEKALAMAKKEMPPPEDGSEISHSAAFDYIVTAWATMKSQNG